MASSVLFVVRLCSEVATIGFESSVRTMDQQCVGWVKDVFNQRGEAEKVVPAFLRMPFNQSELRAQVDPCGLS